MAEFNYIEFQRTRDFSNKMNATFEFLKQNFKSFFKSVLYLAGPPAVVSSLLMGSVFSAYMSLAVGMASPGGQDAFQDYLTSFSLWGNVILVVVLTTITIVMLTATVNGYVVLYREKQSNKIEVEEVWAQVKKTFWGYFFTLVGYFMLFVIGYLLLIAIVFGAAAVSPGLSVIIAFGLFGAFVYVLVGASLIYAIQGFEGKGFFSAINRSFYLIRGKWWSTFGLLFVMTLIIYIVSFIFIIPWYISFIVQTMHSIETREFTSDNSMSWFAILSIGVYYLVYYLLTSVPQLALVFQYFNLVEMKESKGLIEQMENMGTAEQPQQHKEDY